MEKTLALPTPKRPFTLEPQQYAFPVMTEAPHVNWLPAPSVRGREPGMAEGVPKTNGRINPKHKQDLRVERHM
jgi:hypothetical protein